jgi:septal ring factor EnvC (AmiA/AmiB activator)
LEKELNRELNEYLGLLKTEAESLETKYTKLSNDAEIALSSERLALDNLNQRDSLINDLQLKQTELSQLNSNLQKQISDLKSEYKVLEKTLKAYENVYSNPIDPIVYLESQWTKDRERFIKENENLARQVDKLQLQNNALTKEIEIKMSSYPDPVEHANLY